MTPLLGIDLGCEIWHFFILKRRTNTFASNLNTFCYIVQNYLFFHSYVAKFEVKYFVLIICLSFQFHWGLGIRSTDTEVSQYRYKDGGLDIRSTDFEAAWISV